MATLNVQEFGAAGDGSSDDTVAIQNALDQASDGDTVYLPAGDYLVSTDDWGGGGVLTIPTDVSDLTVTGDPGYNETRIFVTESEYDDDRNFAVIRVSVSENVIDGLEIRNLTVDGNRPYFNTDESSHGIHCYPSGAGGGHDILIEDCWVENFDGGAVVSREGGVTFNRITSINNKQNYGFSEEDDSTAGTNEYGIVLKNSVSKNANWVGIDHNRGGRVRLANVYSENNGHSGLKTTKDNRRTRVENTTFQDENHFAAMRTNINTTADLPDPPLVIDLDTVAIRNATAGGIYLSGDDSSIQNSALVGGSIELRNCGGDLDGVPAEGGFTFHSASGGSIDELRVIGTESGPGLWYSANHDLDVATYYHANNQGGGVGTWNPDGTLSVGSQYNEDPGQLATPGQSTVGAWSGSADSGSDSGDGSEEPTEPAAPASIETTSGILMTAGGAIQTSAVTPSGFNRVDDFEGYAVGTQLHDTDPWSVVGSFSRNLEVTGTGAATGDQSLRLTGSYIYNAVQSHTGLANYPASDCTIRIATYITDGVHDIAFAVPDGESDFNENCYRIRGGPDYSGNPIIRRTVSGNSDALAVLDSDFPTNTWIEHVIEFEQTGSDVVLTYQGYEWDDTEQTWQQFASRTEGVDTGNNFPDGSGVGLGVYRVGEDAIWFDNIRVGDLGQTAPPDWTPVNETL